jgi:hypothetical protein
MMAGREALHIRRKFNPGDDFSSLGARHHKLILGSWICFTEIYSARAEATNVIVR